MSYESAPPPPPPPGTGGPGAPYGGGGYGGPGAPYGGGEFAQPQTTNVLAVVSLVTGILGLIPCCWSIPVFPAAALITGILGRKQIDDQTGRYKGRGMATAGIVMGGIALAFFVLYWVLFATGTFDGFKFNTSP